MFLVLWPTLVVFRGGDAGGAVGEVDTWEQGCWSGGGGSIVIPRLCRSDVVDLGPRVHGDVPGRCATTTCVSLLAACLFID
jgi:hypothetical protein